MRLSISNIAWDLPEDEQVATLLQAYGVDAIDIAPGKYFPQPAAAKEVEIARVKCWWRDRGIEIIGMQALLFGTTGLNVFGTPPVQQVMLDHLDAICRIAAGVGATRLVFGSPKNRDRTGLFDSIAHDIAADFFGRLGDLAARHGVLICLEPNPTRYGCNFMTGTAETAELVEEIDHPAIWMQLDTGTLHINGEDPAAIVAAHRGIIGHIHASEPDLVPLGDGGADHRRIAAVVAEKLPRHVVTIEMVPTKSEPHAVAIDRALKTAVEYYRHGGTEGGSAR